MLRDPAFWLPLAAGASSRNVGQAFLRFSVRFYLIRMIRPAIFYITFANG